MTRRRWIQQPDGSLVEVDPHSGGTPRNGNGDDALWGDRSYDGLVAPDGTDISSRTKHREYMKRTGMTTYDDFAGEFARKRKERDEYHLGQRGSIKKRDINEAIEYLKSRR